LQDNTQYKDSRNTKITKLLEKGIFKVTPKSKILEGVRIFNSRFVDEVKNKGIKTEHKKSRLVV
jgi:hypothetical protein